MIGWTYESDETAISSAKENLENLNIEKQQEDLQYQIDQIELQKEILENLDENKQKEERKKALEEWSGGKNIADVTTALVDGFKAATLSYNASTGEIINGLGNVVYKGPSVSSKTETKEEERNKALDKLKEYQGVYTSGGFETSEDAGTQGYTAAVDEFNRNRSNVEQAVSEAKNAGVSAENDEYKKAVEWLKKNPEQKDADFILMPSLSSPTSDVVAGHIAELKGTNLRLQAIESKLVDDNDKKQQFDEAPSDHLAVKKYDQNSMTWAAWVNGKGEDIYSLPDYSVVMNNDYIDYYAFVKGGKLYWISDHNGKIKKAPKRDGKEWATGTLSTPDPSPSLINELGTEAIITPSGTLTALPSKTGIVPADITKNVWALGEVAPTLISQLSSLNQKPIAGTQGNTTYEEGQYFDNFTMNVYPTKGDDFSKILEQARAQIRLTRHNN